MFFDCLIFRFVFITLLLVKYFPAYPGILTLTGSFLNFCGQYDWYCNLAFLKIRILLQKGFHPILLSSQGQAIAVASAIFMTNVYCYSLYHLVKYSNELSIHTSLLTRLLNIFITFRLKDRFQMKFQNFHFLLPIMFSKLGTYFKQIILTEYVHRLVLKQKKLY